MIYLRFSSDMNIEVKTNELFPTTLEQDEIKTTSHQKELKQDIDDDIEIVTLEQENLDSNAAVDSDNDVPGSNNEVRTKEDCSDSTKTHSKGGKNDGRDENLKIRISETASMRK